MISWHEIPFVRIVIPLILGIWSSSFIITSPFLLLINFIIFLLLFAVSFKRLSISFYYLFLFILLFIIGYSRASLLNKGEIYTTLQRIENQKIHIVGKISSSPKISKYVKFTLDLSYLGNNSTSLLPAKGKILIYLKPIDSISLPHNGDIIYLQTYLNSIPHSKNPYSFDYAKYLSYQGIGYQAFCNTKEWTILESSAKKSIAQQIEQFRAYCINVLKRYFPDTEQLGIVSAMVLGYKDDINDDLYRAYTDTGTVHVLAVSGLHVGIVAYFILWFLNLFSTKSKLSKLIKISILLTFIWFYALLTGAAPAVIRASIMFSIIIVAKEWNNRTNIYNTIALSAIIMLFINPFLLFQLGFQFSYLAVISIVFFHPFIHKLIPTRNRAIRVIWSYMSVAVSAQILVFPIMLFYFHKFPLYFWLSGILVIPFAGIIIISGIFLILLDILLPAIAAILAQFMQIILTIFNGAIRIIQDLPYSTFDNIWFDQIMVIISYLFLFSLIRLLYTNMKKWALVMSMMALICSTYLSIIHSNNLQQKNVVFYDVQKASLLDFVSALTRYTLSTDSLSEKNIKYVAQGNRINDMITSSTSLNQDYEDNAIVRMNNFIFYKDKVFQFINSEEDAYFSKYADIIILNHADTSVISPMGVHQKLILSGGLDYYRYKHLKNKLIHQGISFHSLREDGALTINLAE